ncbi:sensor histidine kinase [Streptomyces sp. T-3]|nr:sensor histidine kinase [Streptomyces sp. T-3]
MTSDEAKTDDRAQRPLAYARDVLRKDLFTLAPDPMPPLSGPRWLGWLRWLPYAPFCLLAIPLFLGNASAVRQGFGVIPELGYLFTALQSVALVLALRRPVAAWWLCTGAGLFLATVAESASGGAPWPWTGFGIALECLVLLLLALRVPARAAAQVLAITVGGTYLVFLMSRPQGDYQSFATFSAILFALSVVVGATLRSFRESAARLSQQEERTEEERRHRTLLEERSRIARELHDVVAHHMSVISIQAQVAPHLVKDPSEELKENLAGIRSNAVEALTELRRVLGVLRSETPEEAPDAPQPTLDRLGSLVGNARAAGLRVTCELTGTDRPLSPGIELSVFRIVQEALSNAMRHAPGSDVRVEVERAEHSVRVRVHNGPPKSPVDPSPGMGHGLLGMRERAAMLGGELAAGPTPQAGYEVTAFLPLAP